MKRAVVSGAAGFLGYHLVRELAGHGVYVCAVCRPGSDHAKRLQELPNVKIIFCDLREMESLPEKCEDKGFDVFYHLAWQGASGKERADSTVQAENLSAALWAVKSADKMGCKKFVAAGTVCEHQCGAIIERNIQTPSAFYLLAKEAAYKMAKAECLIRKLPFVWCTFYHPIGKYNKSNQLIASVILQLMNHKTPAFGPANQWFDIIAVEDLSRGLYLAGERTLPKDKYFIGSGKPRKLREYLEQVKEEMHAEEKLRFSVYPDDGLPMEYGWLNAQPFCEDAGFIPQISFTESLKRTCEWLKDGEENA